MEVQRSCAALWPAMRSQSIKVESIPAAVQLNTIVDGSVVNAGGVRSVKTNLAVVVSKLLHPSPARNITTIAALHVSLIEGEGGIVLQKIELQSSVAVAPPCDWSHRLKTIEIFGLLQLPLPSEAWVVMTGATLLVMVNVRTTVLMLLQLSVAVKVTSITPQKEVIVAGEGALSVFDKRPHPLSVAVKAAR